MNNIHAQSGANLEKHTALGLFGGRFEPWRELGLHKCKGKRCEVCLNVQETSCFSSSGTNETYKINHQFECNEKCLVYLLTCKKCLKQYVGQTIDTFRNHWNNYKSDNRKLQRSEPCMQEHLFRHFSSPGHNGFLNDV